MEMIYKYDPDVFLGVNFIYLQYLFIIDRDSNLLMSWSVINMSLKNM